MHYAIISDLHGNLQGLEAVLADIRHHQHDALICLGDIIGYGPQPAETLALCRGECRSFVLGNHDAVAAGLLDMACFNEDAQRSTRWTLSQLDEQAEEFFKCMPLVVEEPGIFFSHATLSNPAGFGYLDSAEDAAPEFLARPESMMFVGHTHHAKVFELDEAAGEVGELPAEDFRMREGCRYIVNPGSVGDPRTPEPLARYVSLDTGSGIVRFHALAFDLDAYREAWRVSRSPYQQYFHRCLDGDISMTAEGERIVPPPLLVARKVAAGAGLVRGRARESPAESPLLMARGRRGIVGSGGGGAGAGRAAAVSLAGRERVPVLARTGGGLNVGEVVMPRQFPWMAVLVVLFLALCAWVGYLRFFTDAGIGMTRQAREAEALHQRGGEADAPARGEDEDEEADTSR